MVRFPTNAQPTRHLRQVWRGMSFDRILAGFYFFHSTVAVCWGVKMGRDFIHGESLFLVCYDLFASLFYFSLAGIIFQVIVSEKP